MSVCATRGVSRFVCSRVFLVFLCFVFFSDVPVPVSGCGGANQGINRSIREKQQSENPRRVYRGGAGQGKQIEFRFQKTLEERTDN